MAQYINKDALVAEIESLRRTSFTNFDEGVNATVQTLLETLDTLEVKEVDLENLVEDFCYEYDNRKEMWYELCPNDRKLLHSPTWSNFAMSIAKHFFELGMRQLKNDNNNEEIKID